MHGHGLLVEVEAELRLVVEVALALNVEGAGVRRLELLGHAVGAVEELLQKVGRNGEVVAASELGDFAHVAERGAHDNGVVVVLFVVVEDLHDGLDARVLLGGVLLLGLGLVPVEDAADEGGDEESTGLGGGNSLHEGEHEGQVAVDAVLALQDVGGLDTLPGRGELDQHALLLDADFLVELGEYNVSLTILNFRLSSNVFKLTSIM